MDLSAIIDEFNRRKAQAGQGIADTLGLQKKPADWFSQMQQGQNAVVTPEQRSNVNKELADMLERFTAGVVPEPIRARDRAMQTDPSAAAKPFTSEEVKGITPFVTAAAPIAYHGTPHTFDKFDASKIGTGQGAQSYGHGLYFAENPDVAKTYRNELAGERFVATDPEGKWRVFETKLFGKGESPITNALSSKDEAQAALKAMPTPGNTYQVNIPDQHAARMLDWDKPLSEQAPEVQAAINKLIPEIKDPPTYLKDMTGSWLYNTLSHNLGNYNRSATGAADTAATSKLLADAGIPGIKYLDQGSRTAGQGTRNFVVFDPAILQDVTRK